MADLNARIIAKASGTAGETPQSLDLEVAEIAVNTADGKFFTKHTDGTIKEISGGGGAVESVNGQTGAVELGIQDMDDFSYATAQGIYGWDTYSNNAEVAGSFDFRSYQDKSHLELNNLDNDSVDRRSVFESLTYPRTIWIKQGTNDWYSKTVNEFQTDALAFFLRMDRYDPNIYDGPVSVSLSDPGTGFAPLIEGDILQWNYADQQFKPAQLPAGGGGVDSVNGETGAVSLGIQDMNDYALQDASGSYYGLTQGTSSYTAVASPNDYYISGGASSSLFVMPGNWNASITVGETLTIQRADQATGFTYTIEAIYTESSGAIRYKFIEEVDPSLDYPSSLYLGGITVSSASIGASTKPLAEGDILRWDNADQKFKPAQSPVGSVNGQTGVVELSAFDLTDVALAYAPASETWSTPNTSNPGAEQFRLYASGGARLSTTTANGYRKDELLSYLTAGANLEIIVNSITHTATITSATPDLVGAGGPSEYLSVGLDVSPALANTNSADSSLVINFLDVGAVDTPLAEGDILQWNNADQKFKPTQLPTGGGGGAVDSVNGETGVVSLGIQDMNDFELATVEGIYEWDVYDQNVVDPGSFEFTTYGPSSSLWLNNLDKDGVNRVSVFEDLSYPRTVWLKQGDGSWYSKTASELEVDSARGRMIFTFSSYDPSNVGPVLVSVSDPGTGLTPLDEGDILRWDNTAQKFKPAQLPSGGGGVEEAPEDGTPYVRQDADWVAAPSGGGGGGAVDSVNGETGTVSLGVRNLDDVAYVPNGDASWEVCSAGDASSSSGLPSGKAYRSGDNLRFSPISQTGDISSDLVAWLQTLSVGDALTLLVNGGEEPGFIFSNYIDSSTDSGPYKPRITINGDPGIDDLLVGATLAIKEFNQYLGATFMDPVEGDILVYSATTQKWGPQQPAQAKDNIQDMDDFELNKVPAGARYECGTQTFPGNGLWYNNANRFSFGASDADGVDMSVAITQASGSIFWSYDGSSWEEAFFSDVSPTPFGDSFYVDVAPGTGPSAVGSPELYLSFSTPGASVDAPLVEGDILQWDDSDQVFKPAQTKDNIQDMDDFQLEDDPAKQSNPAYTTGWNWFGVSGNSSAAQSHQNGNFVTTLGAWWVSPFAENNTDLKTVLRAWLATLSVYDTIKVRYDSSILGDASEYDFQYTGHTDQMDSTGTYQPRLTFDGNLPDGGNLSSHTTNFRILSLEQYAVDNGLATPVYEEAELFEGDILRWNDTDKKFKPTFLPAGGGAVDSVNGETGVVELDIQDMGDFELNEGISRSVILDTKVAYPCGNDGEFSNLGSNNANIGNYFTYFGGGDDQVQFQKLEAGDALLFTFDDGSTHSTTFVTNQLNGSGEWWARVADAWPAGATNTTSLRVTNSKFDEVAGGGVTPFPLADGDTLQWVEVEQKFKPAQAKDNIQDMDDFELNTYTAPFTPYSFNAQSNGNGIQSGEWRPLLSDNKIIFQKYDSALTEMTGILQSLSSPGSIWISVDGGTTYTEVPYDTVSASSPPDNTEFEGSQINTILSGLGVQEFVTNCIISAVAPSGTGTVALANGDTLRWNDADQKFKPVQYKSNIQDMDDFELNTTTTEGNAAPPAEGTWDYKLAYDQNMCDDAGKAQSNPYFQLAFIDRDAVNHEAFFNTLSAGDELWIQLGNGTPEKITLGGEALAAEANNCRFIFQPLPAGTDSLANDDVVQMWTSDPGITEAEIPLAEGDILQWSDADQRFKPAQLPEVIDKATLQAEVAASTDFADFQSRIAAL